MIKQEKYIKSPLNYTGGKYKILEISDKRISGKIAVKIMFLEKFIKISDAQITNKRIKQKKE